MAKIEIPEGVELVIDLQGNELKANTESEQKLIVNSGKLTINPNGGKYEENTNSKVIEED